MGDSDHHPEPGRRRVLIVGQAPSRTSDPSRPLLGGHSGERLRALMGVSLRTYIRLFDRRNLVERYPGTDALPPWAGDMADQVFAQADGRPILAVGMAVGAALGVGPILCWQQVRWPNPKDLQEPARVACIPHVSGRNRWWSDPANAARGRTFLAQVVDLAQADQAARLDEAARNVAARLKLLRRARRKILEDEARGTIRPREAAQRAGLEAEMRSLGWAEDGP